MDNLPKETKSTNFEEFWIGRVGKTLYERFNKFYNLKAWQLKSNTAMNFGFEATVKRKPLETDLDMSFHLGILMHIQFQMMDNKFFDVALDGCQVILNCLIKKVDLDKKNIH